MLIVNYRAEWKNHFEKISEKLSGALIDLCVRIEHIGTTAVPELAAKPIVDIDIVYENPSDFDRIKENVSSFGYYHNGNQGVVGREVFKRIGEKKRFFRLYSG